jgi:hypothetical protein
MENENNNEKGGVEVKFTDVMRIIADDNTPMDTKMVYIYLLNVIMDFDEQLGKLSHKVETWECNCSCKE